jgi:7-carboxy-7-deazaguanine synthase
MSQNRLKITEIFYSIQGESNSIGWPTVFVRLTGCPLRCQYCDTEYAFFGGQWMQMGEILEQVAGYGASYVTVTGGEPLAQKRCIGLLQQLCDANYQVSLETSGALDISNVDRRVSRVVDIKTPDSGEQARNLWTNIEHLSSHDQLKFVICSREDYQWSRDKLAELSLPNGLQVMFSPSFEQVDQTALAEWILADRLPVRYQLQMHKFLWGDQPGH